ncbi:MAG: YoaK family protein, partial [Oscillospiraceae bacterium]
LQYVCPVLAFAIGIAAAEFVRRKFTNRKHVHWRQIIVFCEAVILFGVMFIPQELNLLANSLTSLACGAQVESFRKIQGNGMATTMCIGNLRMATQSICDYWFTKDKPAMEKGFLFFGIIAIFTIGAIMGNVSVRLFSEKAILVSSILLITAFSIMLINKED